MALAEERERSEALIQKADASDKYVEEACAVQEELGMSREFLAADRELAAAAKLQAEDGVKFHDELRTCQNALVTERERSKASDNNVEAAREAMNAERDLSACFTWRAGDSRKELGGRAICQSPRRS